VFASVFKYQEPVARTTVMILAPISCVNIFNQMCNRLQEFTQFKGPPRKGAICHHPAWYYECLARARCSS